MNNPCHLRIANKKAMNRAISQSGKHFKMTYLFYGIVLLVTENTFSLTTLKLSSVLPIYLLPGPLTVTDHSTTLSFHSFKCLIAVIIEQIDFSHPEATSSVHLIIIYVSSWLEISFFLSSE